MLVLAGPGSGKTKVLTERIRVLIEEENVRPDSILVITFSKKSALEMQNRFRQIVKGHNYPVNFGTFHAIFYQIVKTYKNFSNSNIITEKEKKNYILDIGIRLGIENATSYSWQHNMLGQISQYKNHGSSYIEEASGVFLTMEDRDEFVKIYEQYIKYCERNEKIDFDDMINICKDILYKHESILRMWQERFEYILVDEFQDINDACYDVLRLLAGDKRNVFCVGDDDQSIYAFRGAKPELLTKFVKQFPGCKRVNLNINYRCCENIVGASDTLIHNNENRINRPRQNTILRQNKGIVDIVNAPNTIIQAEYVCETVQELVREGYCYRDIAVLYRSAHCAKMFQSVAIARDIPVDVKENTINVLESDIARTFIAYVKIALGYGLRSDYFQVINKPDRGLSREALANCEADYMKALFSYYKEQVDKTKVVKKLYEDIAFIRMLPPYAAFIYILKGINIYQYYKNNKGLSEYGSYKLDELVMYIKDITRGIDSLEGFMNYVDCSRLELNDNIKKDGNIIYYPKTNTDKVNLMSAHSSKGLEFRAVFIIGLQEGLFPHNKNLHGKSVEEERRLMYVAMTRAKERLYLCSLSMEHGKNPSRFISEVMADYSFINSNSSLSKNSSNASATASYSSSSSM